jgi:hypothetical protein
MTARPLPFQVPSSSQRTSSKRRSAKCSLASPVSSLTKDLLLQQWERHQQRVQTILLLRPDVGRPIVAALEKVLDVIETAFRGGL